MANHGRRSEALRATEPQNYTFNEQNHKAVRKMLLKKKKTKASSLLLFDEMGGIHYTYTVNLTRLVLKRQASVYIVNINQNELLVLSKRMTNRYSAGI